MWPRAASLLVVASALAILDDHVDGRSATRMDHGMDKQQVCDYSNVWPIDDGVATLSIGLNCQGIDGAAVAQIEAPTHGWLGVGFNRNCSMLGADMFVGWLSSSAAISASAASTDVRAGTVLDMFGLSEEDAPVVDDVQNMGLSDFWENSDGTGLGMLLVTQPGLEDPMDLVPAYPEDPLTILWAYGESAPVGDVLSEEDYHQAQRGCVDFGS